MIKTFKNGTHRALHPQVTLDRIKPLLTHFGITRVANITGLDRLNVPVFMVCRPNAASLAVSQGKGLTPEAAKVSGIMESIECFHAEYIDLPREKKTSKKACQENLTVDINKLAKLQGRIFDENSEINWVTGTNLLDGAPLSVPYECVHINCSRQSAENNSPFITDTNGLASGNTLVEAQNHALCELIERDALALWSYAIPEEKQKRKIQLNKIPDARIQNIIERAISIGLGIGVWDISSDLGVPTFLCKIFNETYYPSNPRPAFGSGTHPSRDVALMRAITEAAQSRLTFISGARDDQYTTRYGEQISLETHTRWHNEIIKIPEARNYSDIAELQFETFEEDQNALCEKIYASGTTQIAWVNLTKERFSIPVVKIIAPGLEGISFSGQRLLGPRGKQAYFNAGERLHA